MMTELLIRKIISFKCVNFHVADVVLMDLNVKARSRYAAAK